MICTKIMILERLYFDEMVKEMNIILQIFDKCHQICNQGFMILNCQTFLFMDHII